MSRDVCGQNYNIFWVHFLHTYVFLFLWTSSTALLIWQFNHFGSIFSGWFDIPHFEPNKCGQSSDRKFKMRQIKKYNMFYWLACEHTHIHTKRKYSNMAEGFLTKYCVPVQKNWILCDDDDDDNRFINHHYIRIKI